MIFVVPLHAKGAGNIPIVTIPTLKCDVMGEGLSITVEIARSKLINLLNYVDETKNILLLYYNILSFYDTVIQERFTQCCKRKSSGIKMLSCDMVRWSMSRIC